jgi:DNA-binding response OmpR family regulator
MKNKKRPAHQQIRGRSLPILVVDEQEERRVAITTMLQEEGWQVLCIQQTKEATEQISSNQSFALLVLALQLPSRQALAEVQTLCQVVHQQQTPLLFILTEPGLEIAFLEQQGLRADDYLSPPFLLEELRACVRTLLRHKTRSTRRVQPRTFPHVPRNPLNEVGHILEDGDLRIDVAGRRVLRGGHEIAIGQPMLFDLLVYLMRHRGEVLSPQQLFSYVWGYQQAEHTVPRVRTVYVHIRWLRTLIEDNPDQPQRIQTIHGAGYRFREEIPSQDH